MNIKLYLKRALSISLVASLLAVSAGCSKEEGEKNANGDEVVTLDWYMLKNVSNASSQEVVESTVNKVLREELGAEISLHLIEGGNYYEKMNTIIAGGEEFDICYQADINRFVNNVRNDAFVPLDELLEEYGQDIISKNDDYAWKITTVDGKIYGVKGQSPYSKQVGTVFKKDLVEKYNFDYESVSNIADLEPYLETIKQNEPSMTPLLPTVTNVSNRYTDTSVKGLIFDEDIEEYVLVYENEFMLDTYRVLNDYYKKGYIAKDAITRTETRSEALSGKYAVMGDSGFYTKDGSKSTSQYGFPCVDAYMGQTTINPKGGAMNCISTTSKNPELALKVLNYIWANPEISNTLAYGVEGVDYEINEERTAEIGEKSITPKSGSASTWTIYHNYIGPLFDQWDSPWNSRESLDNMKELNSTGSKSKGLGFMFNSENVKTEYAKVSSIIGECTPVLTNGCMDDFDTYIADVLSRLEEAGIQKIKDEINTQYKEWKANNN